MIRTRHAGPLVLLGTLLLIVAIDRVLLAYYGLPRWEEDPVLHFRQRPDVRRTWAAYPGGKPLRTNQLGFYDDDFPRTKPAGEFRALAIGDSVIMGHGVTTDEALPNQLEARLIAHHAGSPAPFRSYQVVNAGVEGYWTDQYVEVLRRNLDLAPDLPFRFQLGRADLQEPQRILAPACRLLRRRVSRCHPATRGGAGGRGEATRPVV